ncbi:chromosomal replication initiator protein DnaA [Candidatus Shapirobacteria bacterium CG03_land_8_20_14_0_80_40_19]|uniref:Chromosomal replication initiator protein DnaA n=2 Tax=Candidatus Shapironibacteriota TaxID=1752721 RepID=A0A2M7BBA0_9BACT|nr:MAG: chromosomal replication initiator protein DnaA [Candidatus Shapirobacteria bacterium CG11_big_fil_rev_8_21_14_0_20_40_12]PIV00383.1 MAG: chromosomal replication initiator protein DnaA [Candidatus Shapirobacteria bacterium CG03_land_8_20_14_0_80_40_19]
MTNEQLWKNVLEELKISISEAVYKTLFHRSCLVSLENNIINIGCPSPYIKDLIEKRYYSFLKDILDRQTKQNNSLLFTVKTIVLKNQMETGPLFTSLSPLSPEEIKNPFGRENHKEEYRLRSDFTFENFAVSSSNQLPFAAATAVAKNPGSAYNPLFLWGGVGVGKTHLMQAIAHEILKGRPRFRIISCPGEEFTNEIINAIRGKTTDQFKKKYRSAQLLLLDDVQFIAGKETVQEEFFHTFNAIQREGGQVVLTSDRPPAEIAKLEERLRSRFEAGLIVDIPAPDFELRTAILLIKAKQKNIDLPMDIAQTIAANIDQNRKMEGFLTRLITESQTKNIPVSLELVNSILGRNTAETELNTKKLKPKEVLEKVAEYYRLKPSQLKASTRVKEIVLPRQILMYLLRVELNLPLVEVGKIIGGRDHTTIMHGVEKITGLLKENEDLRVDISGIRQKLR